MKLVQNTLSRFVDAGQIAGCSVKILKDDEVRFEGYFGYANIEKQKKISISTIFPIASMSKVITVAGIMQLYVGSRERIPARFQKSQSRRGKAGRHGGAGTRQG